MHLYVESPYVSISILVYPSDPSHAEKLQGSGLKLRTVRGLGALLRELGQLKGDALVLASLDAEGVDGEVLRRISDALGGPHRLLLCTRAFSLERAVLARSLGTGRLLTEPVDPAEFRGEVERRRAPERAISLSPDPAPSDGVGLVGSGSAMVEIIRTVIEVGDTPASVLITGESGTGKELVARAVHWASPRRESPFIAINCAAVPENLLESEFFGFEKGAFTGAAARKLGRFERANGGTLFLDEVGEMSVVLQAKLLRALEEGVIERVGGEEPVKVDVRVVAATNQLLEERVEDGSFREDLYYRLAAVRIRVPPLRERMDDLEALSLHFVRHFRDRYERPVEGIGDDALRLLTEYSWPGNIRELRNTLDRAVIACRGRWIRAADLQLGLEPMGLAPTTEAGGVGFPPTTPLEVVERRHIERVLKFTNGAMGEAAELLGIHRNTLTRKVERYELKSEEAPG